MNINFAVHGDTLVIGKHFRLLFHIALYNPIAAVESAQENRPAVSVEIPLADHTAVKNANKARWIAFVHSLGNISKSVILPTPLFISTEKSR